VTVIELHGLHRCVQRAMHDLYLQKENVYWASCIASNAGNSKRLWKSVSSILKKDNDPFAMQPSVTADQLSKFFRDKIESVRAATNDADPPTFTVYAGKQITSFCECSMEEIRRIMFRCPVKTCLLDPIPTDILLESVDAVLR